MANRLRYTGAWPPPDILAQLPNWVFALDEEGTEGHDETTLKPETQQLYLSGETCFTAAEVKLADGSARVVILRMESTIPSALDVFEKQDWWSLKRGRGKKWEAESEHWLSEAERRPSVSLDDRNIFPLLVRSRLPRSDGKVLTLSIRSDGLAELNWL